MWSGNSDFSSAYTTKGVGTFCVNPVSGLSGFFVGESSLAEHIAAETSPFISEISTTSVALSSAMEDYAELSATRYSLAEAVLVPADGGLSCAVEDQTVTTV